MLDHLQSFFETKSPVELHLFRIQIKKMKALLLFLQTDGQAKHETGYLHSLQSIFKHAGRIRSAHINLGLLKRHRVTDPSYTLELEHIEKKESEQFYAKRNAYIKTVKQIRKVLAEEFQDVNDKAIVNLYRRRLKQMARFFRQPETNIDKLHKTRKKIKNLLYLYRILPKKLAQKLHLNDTYLDQLQDVIGKWHDVVMSPKLLKMEGQAKKGNTTAISREQSNLYASIRRLSEDF